MTGVFAALITPVDERGRIDYETFAQLINFVLDRGVDGVCVGGATSEYPCFDLPERKELISQAAAIVAQRTRLIAAIGAPTFPKTLELGECALQAGSDFLLVAMPYFYKYNDEDLDVFTRELTRSLQAPCLLYHLPGFTNSLAVETSIALLSDGAAAGIKDSSGSSSSQKRLTEAHQELGFTLLNGADELLLSGLKSGWDGAISGTANLFPELLVNLYQSASAGDWDRAGLYQHRLNALISRMAGLPFPWAIRVGMQVRRISTGPLPLPLSASRQSEAADLLLWLEDRLEEFTLPDRGSDYSRPSRDSLA